MIWHGDSPILQPQKATAPLLAAAPDNNSGYVTVLCICGGVVAGQREAMPLNLGGYSLMGAIEWSSRGGGRAAPSAGSFPSHAGALQADGW